MERDIAAIAADQDVWTLSRLSDCFHSNIIYFLETFDLNLVKAAFGVAWIRRTIPDLAWRRYIHMRSLDTYIHLLPPPSSSIPQSWLMYVVESRPWKFYIEIFDQTLLGYNFIFDESRRTNAFNVLCVRAGTSGLPDFDLWNRRIIVSSYQNTDAMSKAGSFFASYSSFALKATLIDGQGNHRSSALAQCVSTSGGPSAVIVCDGTDWRPQVARWITERADDEILIVVRKKGPSVYKLEKVIARVTVT